MTRAQYENVLPFYWVLAWKTSTKRGLFPVRFSPIEPEPVANNSLEWVKPTFKELKEHNRLLWEASRPELHEGFDWSELQLKGQSLGL